MMPGSGCRKCRSGPRPGFGGMPLALHLSEGFGVILVRESRATKSLSNSNHQAFVLVSQPFHSRALTICGSERLSHSIAVKLDSVFYCGSGENPGTIQVSDSDFVLPFAAQDSQIRPFWSIPLTDPLIACSFCPFRRAWCLARRKRNTVLLATAKKQREKSEGEEAMGRLHGG